MSYADHAASDCRLIILKALAQETDHRLNETLIQKILESFGHTKSRDYVRTQLNKLTELGAVRVSAAGSVQVAELLGPGLDHVERRALLDGVLKPSPGV
ncbi:hypothetical protein J7481_06650 [Labrenzia sp. R4_2]|uniref:VpaChn25_0724 family phage protein n=1 Tax=Labrenzia sp. R4_2 TaxID=2821107 RepID=UPI001ADC8B29|nr:hypothetical protein [Labrenzia sp. R4_2]MBO9419168.1 hypothetical protein [Labrenzia sp. R4_2]